MNFTLSDEQAELQSTVRSVLSTHGSARAWEESLWGRMVDLGWVGLLVPEAHGGSGMGLLEMMVVLEEMGRVPLPGPFLSSSVLATLAARRLDLGDRLASLGAGTARGTVAVDEAGHGDVVDRVRTRASRRSGSWRLSGEKAVVLDAGSADWMIVAARTQQGLGSFIVEPAATAVEEGGTLDVTRSVARVRFDDVAAEPVGPDGDHTPIWRRVVDDAAVCLCAESLGSMEQSFDLAVEYAKARVQFDRPIATFQAIKHKAAEMLERIELSRVGVHYAAWASDAEDAARAEAAAMAKAYVGRAAIELTGEGIQIHGGVGFTWDCDEHLHYRRVKANDLMLGYHGAWRRKVGDRYLRSA